MIAQWSAEHDNGCQSPDGVAQRSRRPLVLTSSGGSAPQTGFAAQTYRTDRACVRAEASEVQLREKRRHKKRVSELNRALCDQARVQSKGCHPSMRSCVVDAAWPADSSPQLQAENSLLQRRISASSKLEQSREAMLVAPVRARSCTLWIGLRKRLLRSVKSCTSLWENTSRREPTSIASEARRHAPEQSKTRS
ncbi:hypothetical protein L1887_50686 [Cichorium endivia]|nr:hypothetical protein L1887_50686 [Cichorium endivia]